jgi:hypothetical protein
VRSERLALLLLGLLLFGGAAIAVGEISRLAHRRLTSTRTSIPGTTTAHLSAGDYVLYYEAPDRSATVPQLSINMASLSGGTVYFSTYRSSSGRYLQSVGVTGQAIFNVSLPRTGQYRISVAGNIPTELQGAADIVLGSQIGHKVQALIIAGIIAVVALLSIVTGLNVAARRPIVNPDEEVVIGD